MEHLQQPLRVFHLGEDLSPYLRTLKEIRALQVEQGSIEELQILLKENQFYAYLEDEQNIVNQYAAFRITKTSASNQSGKSSAPDHLMRLFTYNHLMQQLGRDYFNKEAHAEELVEEAKEAYVVSPVSSMIVLETQEDYERFDIKKSQNSLRNAAIRDSGAVPEPHEWVLIGLVVLATFFLYWKRAL